MQDTIGTQPMENIHNVQETQFIIFMNIVNTVTHILLGAVAFAAICFANLISFSGSFKAHIYLCVIGYVILMGQAVLVISPYNSWTNALIYQDKKICHWVMQVLGSVLAIAGSIMRLTDTSFTHFSTAHGILGIVAMILTILSLIGGILNIFSSNLNINVKFMKVCHSGLGVTVIITSFLSLALAYHDGYRYILGDSNATLMITLTIFALLGTVLTAGMRFFSRICQS